MDIQERIAQIEKEIRETPYHKGTEHHIGLLRARLARFEDQVLERQSKGGSRGRGFAIRKAGDATVVLVGPPSVGKSTLLNALTNAKSPVAPYEFTTVTVIPGMMNYRGAMIQIMDVPGLIEGASRGHGRGKQVLSVIRGADLILLVTEVGREEMLTKMRQELFEAGVRLDHERPEIHIEKRSKGGIQIRGIKQPVSHETLQSIFHEFGLKNAEITLRGQMSLDQLVDALSQNRIFVPAIYVVSKSDLHPEVSIQFHPGGGIGTPPRERVIMISAKTGVGLEELREMIWNKLGLVRVYLARPGGETDFNDQIIMQFGNTLSDVVEKLGVKGKGITHARISGPGSKFRNQQVSLSIPVVDEMVVTFE